MIVYSVPLRSAAQALNAGNLFLSCLTSATAAFWMGSGDRGIRNTESALAGGAHKHTRATTRRALPSNPARALRCLDAFMRSPILPLGGGSPSSRAAPPGIVTANSTALSLSRTALGTEMCLGPCRGKEASCSVSQGRTPPLSGNQKSATGGRRGKGLCLGERRRPEHKPKSSKAVADPRKAKLEIAGRRSLFFFFFF